MTIFYVAIVSVLTWRTTAQPLTTRPDRGQWRHQRESLGSLPATGNIQPPLCQKSLRLCLKTPSNLLHFCYPEKVTKEVTLCFFLNKTFLILVIHVNFSLNIIPRLGDTKGALYFQAAWEIEKLKFSCLKKLLTMILVTLQIYLLMYLKLSCVSQVTSKAI